MDEFEQHLTRQSLREPLPAWRSEILVTARASAQTAAAMNPPTPANLPWWREWLWPSPVAWGTVAGIWLLIFALNLESAPSHSDSHPILAGRTPPTSQELLLAFAQQQQLVNSLLHPEVQTATVPPSPRPATPGACLRPRDEETSALV